DRLLTFQVNAPPLAVPARVEYYDRLFAALDAIPGVSATGGTTRVPLGSTHVTTVVTIDGRDVPAAKLPEVEFRRSQNNYFAAMGIPVLRGRDFTRDDALGLPGVCIINRTMAARLFPDEIPFDGPPHTGSDPATP